MSILHIYITRFAVKAEVVGSGIRTVDRLANEMPLRHAGVRLFSLIFFARLSTNFFPLSYICND
jgi:hypothetical protein